LCDPYGSCKDRERQHTDSTRGHSDGMRVLVLDEGMPMFEASVERSCARRYVILPAFIRFVHVECMSSLLHSWYCASFCFYSLVAWYYTVVVCTSNLCLGLLPE
jgi:hypothetical protein